MEKSTFELEKKLINNEYDFVIGIDEVGRGPLAGPVVACAAAVKGICHPERSEGSREIFTRFFADAQNDNNFELIRDSKTLSEKQREKIYEFIEENFYVGIGICDHKTIDRINILEASFLAMKSAVTSLRKEIRKKGVADSKIMILLDGNKKIPNFSLEQQAIIGGDKTIKSISAASIFAKVTRDRMMEEMHEVYPEYGFAKHKGYGTAFHMNALRENGPCEIHRKSFKPVKNSIDRKSIK